MYLFHLKKCSGAPSDGKCGLEGYDRLVCVKVMLVLLCRLKVSTGEFLTHEKQSQAGHHLGSMFKVQWLDVCSL
jgi:hypothetical protein